MTDLYIIIQSFFEDDENTQRVKLSYSNNFDVTRVIKKKANQFWNEVTIYAKSKYGDPLKIILHEGDAKELTEALIKALG
jgi:hypothetical protein